MESASNESLEVGHVLFIDIVGYSTLLIDEQKDQLDRLTEIVLATAQVREATDEQLVRLPTGDGVALVFRHTVAEPVRCALEVARSLRDYPGVRVRMGIHSGPVTTVTDVSGRINIAGAGINLAQRVMDCGDAGHILLSRRVAEDITHFREWSPYVHEIGECAVKHGVVVHLSSFHGPDFGNPARPAKVMAAKAGAARARRSTFVRRAALVLILIGGLSAAAWLWKRDRLEQATLHDKSIAVLPFQNFSADKTNAFFADGIQDDILTSLARIKDLRVISRSSVTQYRDAAAQNLNQIGKTLGVANVLEGSVRREGDRVVVNVQLIDARSSRQIWANHYDRTLADSLGLQGQLAREIADALRATLSPDEQARVTARLTKNPDAYVFYLRANQIARNPDTLLEDYKTAEQLYRQAIALDPEFALAHARLASVCAEIFHYYEPTEDWKTKARTEAEIALRLQPSLAEAHFAEGQYLYWVDQNYERALEQFNISASLSPSDGDTARLIAAIDRRQGHWERSLQEYQRVAKLDPQNPNTIRELIYINTAMRRWPEAAHWAERMRTMVPSSIVAKIQSGYVDFWWKGDTDLLKSLLAAIPADDDPDGAVTACRWEVAMLKRDYAGAGQVLQGSALRELSYTNAGGTPKSFFEACIYLAQGDEASAQEKFALARPSFEAAVKEAPQSAYRHANLGWLYGFMGRKEDAIREGRRAVELKPESKDAVDGVLMNCYLALIYARLGEKDLALPLVQRLLKTPGAVDSVDYSITLNDLKYRWEWDPLRSDVRFQRLLNGASALDHTGTD